MKYPSLVCLALVALLCDRSAAEERLRAGRWRRTDTSEIFDLSGLPAKDASKPGKNLGGSATKEGCMDEAEASAGIRMLWSAFQDRDCTTDDVKVADGKVRGIVRCSVRERRGTSEMTVNGSYTPETINLNWHGVVFDNATPDLRVRTMMTQNAVYVGACKQDDAEASTTKGGPRAEAEARAANEAALSLLKDKKVAEALPLLRQAADAGVAQAQHNVGLCYLNGDGVEKDLVIAQSWFERAARRGWMDAQFMVAYDYANGRGVEKDPNKSHHWCLEAAAQGDSECHLIVAGNYLKGTGVDQDVAIGLKWVSELAAKDNLSDRKMSGQITSARFNLARTYRQGLWGVGVNNAEAYKWLLLTNESKRDFAAGMQDEIVAEVKATEALLTDEEKRQARRSAEALINRALRNFERRSQRES